MIVAKKTTVLPPAMTDPSSLGQAAAAYARRGWGVFPCRPRSKQPATPHGCKDATTDVDRIVRYWQRVPDANVAVATGPASELWILDVDMPDGIESLRALESQHAQLPHTLTQRTGGGGLQLFWRWPAAREVRNSAGRLGAGLDVRGVGGYIVAPPSVHPDTGEQYVWLDHGLDCVTDAPGWLLDLLVSAPTPKPAAQRSESGLGRGIGGVLAHLAAQGEGNRNSATFWAACKLRDRNIPQADADALLMPIASALGLPEVEAQRTIQSAYRGRR